MGLCGSFGEALPSMRTWGLSSVGVRVVSSVWLQVFSWVRVGFHFTARMSDSSCRQCLRWRLRNSRECLDRGRPAQSVSHALVLQY